MLIYTNKCVVFAIQVALTALFLWGACLNGNFFLPDIYDLPLISTTRLLKGAFDIARASVVSTVNSSVATGLLHPVSYMQWECHYTDFSNFRLIFILLFLPIRVSAVLVDLGL